MTFKHKYDNICIMFNPEGFNHSEKDLNTSNQKPLLNGYEESFFDELDAASLDSSEQNMSVSEPLDTFDPTDFASLDSPEDDIVTSEPVDTFDPTDFASLDSPEDLEAQHNDITNYSIPINPMYDETVDDIYEIRESGEHEGRAK